MSPTVCNRFGGLASRNPVIKAEEYTASTAMTAELTNGIVNQHDEVSSINNMAVQLTKDLFRKKKGER
jgi:hypothetical protein